MINKTEEEVRNILESVAKLCNSEKDAKEVATSIRYLHRTYQQNLGRFLRAAIDKFDDLYEDKYYDQRNEATCTMCHAIRKEVDENILPFI